MEILDNQSPIAYFCAEFGLDNDLPTYSGGLGILAGDTMNAAADLNYPVVGLGILYKGKSFIQHITANGKEEKRDSEFDHDTSFLRPTTKDGKVVRIPVLSQENGIFAKAYQVRLGDNTTSYFLSTDIDGNPQEWITDMDTLYSGDTSSVLRQMILLGVGGVRLIDHLGLKPPYYHINEGRPSFSVWEIAKHISETKNIDFKTAWSKAKEKIMRRAGL